MSIFIKGANWDASRVADLERSRKTAWAVSGVFGFCLVVAIGALAALTPLRRSIPYVVKQDAQTGNLEVLQAFDNRTIGNQELTNKYWARKYVMAREQYNWYLVGTDFDVVTQLTDPQIVNDYRSQFVGDKGLDKVFGATTERKISILSIAPSPTNANLMVVRFERTTTTKGVVVESPTIFVANLAFKFIPSVYGPEVDLIRNPLGYQVYSYRRDVELPGSPLAPAATAVAQPSGG